MVSVASLLNPVLDEHRQLPSPCSTRYTPPLTPAPSSRSPSFPPNKKQKMSKDAPVFARGKVQGQIRYPPWESYDDDLAAEIRRFSVYPLGRISEFRRHIPYNSDKKSFLEKTGRGAFEVFQYTFTLPNEDKEYTVMWDYNIGLVRITPFFKCCQYAKTVPAKMLNSNPGLREICHSITGGALAAQGYWMPFEAAKAVAATFCFSIRYALTPVFGPDFPLQCIKPGTNGYSRMIIDPLIVQRCAAESRSYREISSREGTSTPSPMALSAFTSSPLVNCQSSSPSETKPHARGRGPHPLDIESGYYTDTDRSVDSYLPSPQSNFTWTPANQPRSTVGGKLNLPLPSPRDIFANVSVRHSPPLALANSPHGSDDSGDISPKTKRVEHVSGPGLEKVDDCALATLAERASALVPAKRARSPEQDAGITNTREMRAAYVLMQLHFADASLKDNEMSTKKRRASG